MRVQFTATTAEKLDTVPKIDGQIVAVLDQLGYYYDYNGVRYQVNDGGSFVKFIQDLPEGTKVGSIEIDGETTDLYAPTPPTKVSELTNNVGFVTNLVSNLLNYYLKSETYSKSEVDALVSAVQGISFKSVDVLPTTDIRTDVIYLVPKDVPISSNTKDEYINTTGDSSGWELIGDTEMDLSSYVKKPELADILSEYALISQVPTKTSELTNDSNFIADPDYVHTDNNFTDEDVARLSEASVVSVEQKLIRGTEIASITINGVTTPIYSSAGLLPRIIATTEDGSTVTATDGVDTIEAVQTGVGTYQLDVTDYGTWTVSSIFEEESAQATVEVDAVKIYNIDVPHFKPVEITVTFPAGTTGYFGKQGETPVAVTESPFTYTATSAGTYVATVTYDGVSYATEFNVESGAADIDNFCPAPEDPDLAANTVATWLMYGDVSGSYSSLAAVLNDTAALAKLMASSYAVDYMLRSTSWMADIANSTNALNAIGGNDMAAVKVLCNDAWNSYLYNKYQGATQPYLATLVGTHAPAMTSDTTPSGRVVYDSQISGHEAYRAIWSSGATWQSADSSDLHFIGYDFEISNILLTNVFVSLQVSGSSNELIVQGSVDGNTWEDIETCSIGSGTYKLLNYCTPSKLQGYRATRVVYTGGGTVTVSLMNVWGRVLGNT